MNPSPADAHGDALATLLAWAPPDAAQAHLREQYVSHLESHPDALERSCAPGHLTAGVIVLSDGLDMVLLNLHRKARRWFHLGGHWEPGDPTLLATATREGTEESGIAGLRVDPQPVHLDVHDVEFCSGHGQVAHLDVRYAAVAPHGATPSPSEESLDVRWWPRHALPPLEPEMHDLIRLALQRSQSTGRSVPSRRAPAE